MSSTSPTVQQKQSGHLTVIIPFKSLPYKKKGYRPCIFCGKTIRIHKFKGKTVCLQCLLQIPDIFPFKVK